MKIDNNNQMLDLDWIAFDNFVKETIDYLKETLFK